MAFPLQNPIASNELSSNWMHRGIDLMNAGDLAGLAEAVQCFDQAIALRRTLPLAENPRYRYGLAAGWLNRGDALTRIGGKASLAEAVRSFDEALKLLADLPLRDDPLFARRLAIGWINRGLAVQEQETGANPQEAVRCFREALAVLDNPSAAAIADLILLRAGALTNLAGALRNVPEQSIAEVRGAAQQALALLKEVEQNHAIAAEASLKARHVLCREIAETSRDGKSIPVEMVAEATRAVEEGLALARHWEKRGESRFRALAEDMFRFGCRIYSTGQPDILANFILENLDPERADGVLPLNPETHKAALAALGSALHEIQRDGFQSLSMPGFERMLEKLRELRVTEERLKQLSGAATD